MSGAKVVTFCLITNSFAELLLVYFGNLLNAKRAGLVDPLF